MAAKVSIFDRYFYPMVGGGAAVGGVLCFVLISSLTGRHRAVPLSKVVAEPAVASAPEKADRSAEQSLTKAEASDDISIIAVSKPVEAPKTAAEVKSVAAAPANEDPVMKQEEPSAEVAAAPEEKELP